jgi:DNA-binding NtrC family response regulator
MRVLFVDDELFIRRLVKRSMRRDGHEATLAVDGQDAHQKFTADPSAFDCVFTDIGMPNMDGLALLEQIQDAGHRHPCVLMTGDQDFRQRMRSDLQVFDVLLKPFLMADMRNVMQRIAEHLG